MVLDLVNASVETENAEKYVMIKLTNSVNKFLNQFLNDHEDCNKGDLDDRDKQQLRQDLKDRFLELHKILNPS